MMNDARRKLGLVAGLLLGLWHVGGQDGPTLRAHGRPARPMITQTQLPPLDETPYGVPITVGPPLPSPTAAADAIRASSAHALRHVRRIPMQAPQSSNPEQFVAFTPDGAAMLTDDYIVARIRTLSDGQVIRSFPVLTGNYGQLILSPDGQLLGTSNQEEESFVSLFSTVTGKLMRQHRWGSQVRALAFSSGGQYLAAARYAGRINLWSMAGGSLLADFRAHESFDDTAIAAHPLQPLLLTARSPDTVIDVRAIPDGQLLRSLTPRRRVPMPITDLIYRGDGELLVARAQERVSRPDERRTELMAWRGEQRAGGIGFAGGAIIALNPGLPIVAVARPRQDERTSRDTVCLWDVGSAADPGRCDPILDRLGASVSGLAWSRDGSVLAVSVGPFAEPLTVVPEILLWDLALGRVAGRVHGVWNPRFSPDGSLLVTNSNPTADDDLRLFAVDPELLLTPTATFSPTPTPTASATASASPTSTATRTPRRTHTATPSRTPSPVRILLHLPWLERP